MGNIHRALVPRDLSVNHVWNHDLDTLLDPFQTSEPQHVDGPGAVFEDCVQSFSTAISRFVDRDKSAYELNGITGLGIRDFMILRLVDVAKRKLHQKIPERLYPKFLSQKLTAYRPHTFEVLNRTDQQSALKCHWREDNYHRGKGRTVIMFGCYSYFEVLQTRIMETKRQRQIGEIVRRHFSEVLQQEGSNIYKDALVTVTSVKMTPDLGLAKIYLSVYNTDNKQEVLLSLENEIVRLRQSFAHRVRKQMRRVPELGLYLDDTLDEMYRLNKLFDDLHDNNQMGSEEE